MIRRRIARDKSEVVKSYDLVSRFQTDLILKIFAVLPTLYTENSSGCIYPTNSIGRSVAESNALIGGKGLFWECAALSGALVCSGLEPHGALNPNRSRDK